MDTYINGDVNMGELLCPCALPINILGFTFVTLVIITFRLMYLPNMLLS